MKKIAIMFLLLLQFTACATEDDEEDTGEVEQHYGAGSGSSIGIRVTQFGQTAMNYSHCQGSDCDIPGTGGPAYSEYIRLPSGNPREPNFACRSVPFSTGPAVTFGDGIAENFANGTTGTFEHPSPFPGTGYSGCNLNSSLQDMQTRCASMCGIKPPTATEPAGSTYNSLFCAPVCVFQHTLDDGTVVPSGCYGYCTFTAKAN